MANSTQTATSDGTLDVLDISIEYFDRSEISVYFNSVLQTEGDTWDWVGVDEKRLSFTPDVPNGVLVLLTRTTNISQLRHKFGSGPGGSAAFTANTLDEDLLQVLHIAQEAKESNLSGDFYNDINMHSHKITNVSPGTNPSDVVIFSQMAGFDADAEASAIAAAASAADAAQSVIDAADASRLTVGTVNTGAPLSAAQVTITGPSGDQLVNFVIPQGPVGPAGPGGDMLKSDNLSGLANYATARSNLGLGTAAVLNVGTSANQVVQLDSGAYLPSGKLKSLTAIRTSNTILAGTDNGTSIRASNTFTQTLTAAATLGDGWNVFYKNNGTGIITFDPNSSELIDGATTLKLYPGQGCWLTCDGTGFVTYGLSTGLVLIQRQVISSAVAQVDFTVGLTDDFDEYVIRFAEVTPSVNDALFFMRVSEDGGTTFKSGGSDYSAQSNYLQAGTNNPAVTTAAQVNLGGGVPSLASEGGINGTVQFFTPANATHAKHFSQHLYCQRTATGPLLITGNSRYIGTNNAINGIRILFNSGNVASGKFALYGVRKL